MATRVSDLAVCVSPKQFHLSVLLETVAKAAQGSNIIWPQPALAQDADSLGVCCAVDEIAAVPGNDLGLFFFRTTVCNR